MEVLLLRFDAPLMSFGGTMVDQNGPTDRFPATSLLAGLLGNALGYTHRHSIELGRLQQRIIYAARWDRSPRPLLDYHTVDLGQEKMASPGWTTRGEPEHRGRGEANQGTHIRYRHYWADGVMTVALALDDDSAPSLDDLAQALRRPARPLFLGRKACLPAAPILLGRTQATDVLDALVAAPPAGAAHGGRAPLECEACWPVDLATTQGRVTTIWDRRDWTNQVHAGSRERREGLLRVEAAP